MIAGLLAPYDRRIQIKFGWVEVRPSAANSYDNSRDWTEVLSRLSDRPRWRVIWHASYIFEQGRSIILYRLTVLISSALWKGRVRSKGWFLRIIEIFRGGGTASCADFSSDGFWLDRNVKVFVFFCLILPADRLRLYTQIAVERCRAQHRQASRLRKVIPIVSGWNFRSSNLDRWFVCVLNN